MEKHGTTSADYDSPCKVALHKYLQWFLAFFFPEIRANIDWTRPYQALEKEFQQIIRRAQVGKQVADMLFQVWLKDGDECWLFIHVEIQGSYEKKLAPPKKSWMNFSRPAGLRCVFKAFSGQINDW